MNDIAFNQFIADYSIGEYQGKEKNDWRDFDFSFLSVPQLLEMQNICAAVAESHYNFVDNLFQESILLGLNNISIELSKQVRINAQKYSS